jgi:hypothetical protein
MRYLGSRPALFFIARGRCDGVFGSLVGAFDRESDHQVFPDVEVLDRPFAQVFA